MVRATYLCDMGGYLGPDPDNCQVPPPGWWCSREPEHGGPCAARPYNDDPRLTRAQQRSQYKRYKAGTLFMEAGSVPLAEPSDLRDLSDPAVQAEIRAKAERAARLSLERKRRRRDREADRGLS